MRGEQANERSNKFTNRQLSMAYHASRDHSFSDGKTQRHHQTRRQEHGVRLSISITNGHRHSKKWPLAQSQSLKPVALSRIPSDLGTL